MFASNRFNIIAAVVFIMVGAFTQMPSVLSRDLVARPATSGLGSPSRVPQLDIAVKIVEGKIYTTENIPLEVVLTNVSSETINLLNAFDTPNRKRIFFTVTLRDGNESPFFTSGGGKISFSKDSMKYIELKPGEQTSISISLLDYDLPLDTLKEGLYSVLVTYRNQYGEGCFKGTVSSLPLDLILNKT